MPPGMGDEIQAIKAGITEITDIFVVNKSDRVGADKRVNELETIKSCHELMEKYFIFAGGSSGSWRHPIGSGPPG